MASTSETDAGAAPLDPLGAFCRDNHVALEGAAEGPLAGLTFGAKDLFHVKGARTGFGQPDWLRSHEPAEETAEAIQQLLDAGARLLGKTLTDELAYSLTGENVHYGTPTNPHDSRRVPGGSSNGSASAVAGGLVDFALGSDCGGSIRLPASYCGLLGIRPTHDRTSLRGAIPFGPSFDVAGWFARDAEIFARVGDVLLRGPADHSPPQRLVMVKDAFALAEPGVGDSLAPAISALGHAIGADAEEITLSPRGLGEWFEAFRVLQAAEVWANHGDWIRRYRPSLGPGVKERIEWAADVTAEQAAAAGAARREIFARLDHHLRPGTIFCLPTSPRIAPLRNTATEKIEIEYRHHAMCSLCISGLGGLPQISLPLATLDGMPLGLSIIGPKNSDEVLLALARDIMRGLDSEAPPRTVGPSPT